MTTYTLDLVVNPKGSGTVTRAGTYTAGATILVTTTSNDGYTFVSWTGREGNTVSTEVSFEYIVPESDATLTASFGKGMLEVRWLSSVTNEGFVLQGGTALLLKFQLINRNGEVVREVQEGISLKI
ncbi:hypothetical protein [Methanoculleus sp. 10]|jgi:uncharacterized repeat protein (TIGR02543 family)|uniref:InlB B-repeat-containing protein n=1 Tax=Methanoculleus sp. 10 TaxID=430615 RepID=UPI0025E86EDD|nr:hypothetical protein [Methanoculleus sp. 10]